jgi:hypothetical protein
MKYFKIEDNQICGFYDSEIHDITDVMVEITEEKWKELLEKQSEGYVLTCKDNTPFPQKLGLGESWNGIEILSDLTPIKEKLLKEITDYRDTLRGASTINFNGHAQSYRKSDLSDIDYYQARLQKAQDKAQLVENALAIEEKRTAEKIILTMIWYFYGGTTAALCVSDFDDLIALTDNPIAELYRKEAALKAMVSSMEAIEELKSFDITTMWDIV